jgi:hypothetical protein
MLKRTLAVAILLAAVSCASPTQVPTGPAIALTGNLTFGNVQVGSTAAATLTITNNGNAMLTVNQLTVSASLTSVLTGSWTNGAITAGGAQQVTIYFTPTAAQVFSGDLTVVGNQISGTNTIAVSGTGTTQTPPCNFTLSFPTTISGYPNGGSFPVTVTTTTGCAWTASSTASWIHVPPSTSGNGTGTFTFTVDQNPGSARSGILTIAGQAVTFSQPANAPPVVCAPKTQSALTGAPVSFSATGGSSTFSWSAPGGSPASAGSGSTFSTTYSATGTYTVTVTSGTSDTCSVSITQPQSHVTMTWPMTNVCASTSYFKFYDETDNLVWPDSKDSYSLTTNSSYTYSLSCVAGANICLGASLSADGSNASYGVGLLNNQHCTNCCYSCHSGNAQGTGFFTELTCSNPFGGNRDPNRSLGGLPPLFSFPGLGGQRLTHFPARVLAGPRGPGAALVIVVWWLIALMWLTVLMAIVRHQSPWRLRGHFKTRVSS